MKFRCQTTRYFRQDPSRITVDTNADPLAKFIVYELTLDKTNFELVKVLTEELALLQTELQRVPPANKHLQKQIKNLRT